MANQIYSPIDCGNYDYLEIACMDRYEVEISSNGKLVNGIAVNMETVQGAEYLVLRSIEETDLRIRIDLIEHLRVVTRPSRFQERTFS